MKDMPANFKRSSSYELQPARNRRAFTLIELVAVIGIVAVLAATLLPALASTRFRDQLVMCTANFRQWGVAWLSGASDTSDGSFPSPSFPPSAGGPGVWDEPLSLVSNMAPYGVTLRMWYCPVRSWLFAQDNAYIQSTFGHPETTLADFVQAVAYAHNPSAGVGLMHHNFWIQRYANGLLFPSTHNGNSPYAGANLGLPWPYNWLRKPSDPQAAQIPIMTDQIISASTSSMPPGQGHPFGGSQRGAVYNENLLYGDGHVETHQTNSMAWRYRSGLSYVAWY